MKPQNDYTDEGNCILAAGVTILIVIVTLGAVAYLLGWIA